MAGRQTGSFQGRGGGDGATNSEDEREMATQKWLDLVKDKKPDWEMVGVDGHPLLCHELVLAERVPHFKTLFAHEETLEKETQRIQVPEEVGMSRDGVVAFLMYVYFEEEKGIMDSYEVASSMIRAGHFYDFPEVVEVALKAFEKNRTNLEWFNREDLWELLKFVWLWDISHPLKFRLLECLLKLMNVVFKTRKELNDLMGSNTETEVIRETVEMYYPISLDWLPKPEPQNPTLFTRRGGRVYPFRDGYFVNHSAQEDEGEGRLSAQEDEGDERLSAGEDEAQSTYYRMFRYTLDPE